MPRSVYGKTLWDARRAIGGWLIGVLAVTLLYSSSYKAIGGPKGDVMKNYPESLQKALHMQDFGTPAGYLGSTVFGILLSFLFSAYAITAAVRAVAGEEETGQLDLLLAHPLSRRRLVVQRFAAMCTVLAAFGAVVLVALLALRNAVGLGGAHGVGAGGLAAAALQLVLLGACVGGVTLLVGAATGRRTLALGEGAAVAVYGYLANSFLPMIGMLHWIRYVSPFYWADGQRALLHGVSAAGCGVLAGAALVALALGAAAFERRDLNV